MKPRREYVAHKPHQRSYLCYEVNVPAFEFLWHYHPEYELTWILKGKGRRIVGDSYESFAEGDLVLMGPLLPHTWVSDKHKKESCKALVIQFPASFIEPLLQYPEMKDIARLLARSRPGLAFSISRHKELQELLIGIEEKESVGSFTSLLLVLQKLSLLKPSFLATDHFHSIKGNENQARINKVFQYVQKEFRGQVSIQKAASFLHLSESAFCKFFKRTSGKTFSDYVNDIRIGHACQLLLETDKPIGEIATASGYESLTYFNRVFLKKKGVRPGELRKHK